MPSPHVLLVNLGTPRAPTTEAVAEFLTEFLGDPLVTGLPPGLWQPILSKLIVPRRSPRVAELYASIWESAGSPLAVGTERIASALRARGLTCTHAYRYGEPNLRGALERAAAAGESTLCVPLFPQPTAATTETIARLVGVHGSASTKLRLMPPDAAGYVAALADRTRHGARTLGAAAPHLVVSFHGIPRRTDRAEGRAYSRACEATCEALVGACAWPQERVTLAYQSRFGPEPWLGPATDQVLAQLPRRGIRQVLVVCPGFVTDGLETIEEIGVRGRATFIAAGGVDFALVPAVLDHPEFLAAIEDLAAS